MCDDQRTCWSLFSLFTQWGAGIFMSTASGLEGQGESPLLLLLPTWVVSRKWSAECSHVIVSEVLDTPLQPLKTLSETCLAVLGRGCHPARGRRGGASEGRCRAALPAGSTGAVWSPASPPLERPQLRCWPEPAPQTRKHLAAGAGWLGPAGVSLGWTVSSLPSAWAVARTPRCTRPTPRWVWAGCARSVRALGTRLLCQPTPCNPGWVTGQAVQERRPP